MKPSFAIGMASGVILAALISIFGKYTAPVGITSEIDTVQEPLMKHLPVKEIVCVEGRQAYVLYVQNNISILWVATGSSYNPPPCDETTTLGE